MILNWIWWTDILEGGCFLVHESLINNKINQRAKNCEKCNDPKYSLKNICRHSYHLRSMATGSVCKCWNILCVTACLFSRATFFFVLWSFVRNIYINCRQTTSTRPDSIIFQYRIPNSFTSTELFNANLNYVSDNWKGLSNWCHLSFLLKVEDILSKF